MSEGNPLRTLARYAPPPWDPSTSDNLLFWIDPSDGSTVTKDGSGYVSQVDDKGPNAFAMTRTADANVHHNSTLNGLSVLRFLGATRYLVGSGNLFDFFPNANDASVDIRYDYTFGMVFADDGAGPHQFIFDAYNASRGYNYRTGSTGRSGAGTADQHDGAVGTTARGDGVEVCHTTWRDGSNTLDAVKKFGCNEDGVAVSQLRNGTDLAGQTDGALTTFRFGTTSTGGSTDIRLCEIVFLEGYSELDDLETYLMNRWGIT